MDLIWSILLVIGGLLLVIFFSEQLVKGVAGTSMHFHVPAFLISVVFLGFDPENLGVGTVGSFEHVGGIAMGSIVGAAMVAMALALGITALLVPLKFKKISWKLLLVPFVSVLLFSLLAIDGRLGRADGIILIAAYVFSILYLIYLNKKGISIKAGGEISEMLHKEKLPPGWKSGGLLLLSLLAIIGGSKMLVEGSKVLLDHINISDTLYGMTIIALLVSVEEIARELPAALKGKSDISMGNVVGSVLAFFLFNAGVIALVQPVDLADVTLNFYIPLSLATVLLIIFLLFFLQKIPRWAGAILLLIYVGFAITGYLL
ncbi:MAG: hypothetical protein K9G67_13115 [Bacteroidales bacterium]|nr:hypothetical protein [Bacteroidales bacterium]MCF8344318.1 hypothetical protein [Bacteroidales bacterium]MCF8377290.1 hypothetical protein [Bacteroidales bacterium]MCF8401406.1 hypothetical protein [Bacteroidales bacterium]